MKKIFILLIAIMFTFFAKAQNQISVGSSNANEEFFDSKYTSDGGTINVGRITTNGDADCYIVKLNSARQIVWQQRLVNANTLSTSLQTEGFYKVVICANGDFAVAGAITSNGFLRGLVCKLNNTGNLLWSSVSSTYNGSASNLHGQIFSNLIETINGNIAIVGSTDVTGANNDGTHRGIVLLLNGNGVQQWLREYNFNNNNGFYGINQLANGNIIICGSRLGNNSNYESNILEIAENNAAIISANVYSINVAVPAVNPLTMNTIRCDKIFVTAGIVTIEAYCANGYGASGSPIHGIFTYNQTTRALTGNFYHNSPSGTIGNSTGAYTCYPLAANDYLIGETVRLPNNATQNIITRANNGVISTRIMAGMLGSLGNITTVNGNEFNLVGSVQNGANIDAYSLFAGVSLSIPTPNLCNIQATIPTVIINIAITQTADARVLTAQTGMNQITPTLQTVNGIFINLCGTPPNPIPCPNDTTVTKSKCINQSIQLNARLGSTYSWSPATGLSATNIQNPICSVNTNTTYTCTITNTATNCIYRDIINVTVNPSPISNIPDANVCLGESVQLNAPSGYTSYSWSPATNINNATISNPVVSPPINTTYTVTIFNSFGCSITDDVLVTVNDCHCEDSCNWSLTGNSNVKPSYFIGSRNNADFKVRTNNTQRMVVTATGNIGLNTATPTKTLDVNGEAVVRILPAATPNNKLVLANSTGELKSLAPGATNQFLSGNGTWQTLPIGGGTVTGADQGVTLEGSTVQLGDYCSKGGGEFRSDREVNMNDYNLYFNSAYKGKVRIGNNIFKERFCPELNARLEISSRGLETKNDYVSPVSSPSGLRFTDLTALEKPIDNKYNGVLSLDEDGDVIWVNACCTQLGKGDQITSILERLDKLESELKAVKNENTVLKSKLNQSDVVLDYKQNVLEQNVPNPFTETTTIAYTIVNSFSKAVIVFSAVNGEIIKSVQLNNAGKGQINISASLVAKGIYTYSLIVDGKLIQTKKMIKE
jgi:hypothetical protein